MGPLDEMLVQRFAKQMLYALVAIHQHYIIHGDIKAANILYDGTDIKLSDFGESIRHGSLADAGASNVMT